VLVLLVYHHYPNHNISSDTLAAARVFGTEGLRIDVINDAVTNKLWWTGDPCLALMHVRTTSAGLVSHDTHDTTQHDTHDMRHTRHTTGEQATAPPESEVVGRLLKTWLYYRSGIFFRDVRGTCPHDALTVAEAIYPGADRVQPPPSAPKKKCSVG
jgi:inosine-uridine nucleoside N-ribohydrolase